VPSKDGVSLTQLADLPSLGGNKNFKKDPLDFDFDDLEGSGGNDKEFDSLGKYSNVEK
jgi:hypothetical protein